MAPWMALHRQQVRVMLFILELFEALWREGAYTLLESCHVAYDLVFTSILRSILNLQSKAQEAQTSWLMQKKTTCVWCPRRDGPWKLWISGMWLHGLRELLGTLEWWGKLCLAVSWMRVVSHLIPQLSHGSCRNAEVGRGWDVDWTWRGGLWCLLSLQEWWWKGAGANLLYIIYLYIYILWYT